jgi:ABC-type branched-subunit amino acid transport system permease subunit
MRTRQSVAFALAITVAAGMIGQPALGAGGPQGAGSISGTADKEAKKPFPNYSVRARNVEQGAIAATVPLDAQGAFVLAGIDDKAKYLVELLDPKGKVVCTEGPFDLTQQPAKNGVKINCGKNPAAWWLLAAAGAAGITAGVVANGPASPAR